MNNDNQLKMAVGDYLCNAGEEHHLVQGDHL
jgi:hypothetical protein